MSVSEFGFLHINPLCRCELDISAHTGTEKTERRIWAGGGGRSEGGIGGSGSGWEKGVLGREERG